ncbi:hypothetical protein [Staphylococcus saprophyticus]|uniref:hypothetical protein n=1 Tax=Staphylococcus saprophyticus TaxID=29385 RepID=UPI0015D66A39|nr:hypothetical protein [Staphylococcus saprophyticus]
MNLKQALKITLLIVILAEEIKSVVKKPNYSIKMNLDNEILKKTVDEYLSNCNPSLN